MHTLGYTKWIYWSLTIYKKFTKHFNVWSKHKINTRYTTEEKPWLHTLK